jgi:mannose-6-phosphate isomerase-like protein (cupin superfamily)
MDNMVKKFISAFLLTLLAISALFTVPSASKTGSTAYAAPLETTQKITVYHATSEKNFVVSNDLFTLKPYIHTDSKTNAANLSVIEITTSPHSNPGGFLLQKHAVDVPEDFYIQTGEFEFLGSQPNQSIEVSAGDIVRIPAGVPYGFKNIGSEPGKVLLISPSNGLESLVAEIGTSISDSNVVSASPASTNVVQTDMSKLAAIAHKYGIEFLN